MWLVVGLGNPGATYQQTRHNIGAEIVAQLAGPQAHWQMRSGMQLCKLSNSAMVAPVWLAIPHHYFMNESGKPVADLLRFYRIAVDQLVVVHDELDFPPGEVRLKQGGGSGGHNGLRSLMQWCGPEFIRVRVGIGKPLHKTQGAAYVLARPDLEERQLLEIAGQVVRQVITMTLQKGIAAAQQLLHHKQP